MGRTAGFGLRDSDRGLGFVGTLHSVWEIGHRSRRRPFEIGLGMRLGIGDLAWWAVVGLFEERVRDGSCSRDCCSG